MRRKFAELFNYSYIVLGILFMLTVGATIAYYQNAHLLAGDAAVRWAPVVFLIGLCISLLIFGMTHREATTRATLLRKTFDLIDAQRENKKLLEAEQESRKVAEQANHAKDEFLAVVSHELRTPLNAIAGWTRVLRTPDISGEAREAALEKIDKNLRMQASIVDELLNFSDVMSTGPNLALRPLRIHDVIEEAVDSASVAAFQKGITLDVDLELGETRIKGDHGRLKLAIGSVIANAVKFTPAGGHISVTGCSCDGEVKCVVKDNGLGISPEFLPHVFEQYKQSEVPSTRHFGGLGLGLTIAQHVLQLHNGSIEAASAGAGGGSTFTIHIPAMPSALSAVP
ncbi:MAG TPA: ATP-binding protein [Pyrinomonadaceae bacterium]|nr:ATP-binding protein [Pyrinomonadaceae bacterium]